MDVRRCVASQMRAFPDLYKEKMTDRQYYECYHRADKDGARVEYKFLEAAAQVYNLSIMDIGHFKEYTSYEYVPDNRKYKKSILAMNTFPTTGNTKREYTCLRHPRYGCISSKRRTKKFARLRKQQGSTFFSF